MATGILKVWTGSEWKNTDPSGGSGSGTLRHTHGHIGSGALSIPRLAADQATVVTISANATSWTDNLTTDLDHLYCVLVGNGGSTDYTVDLSALGFGIQDIYPDTKLELSVLKVGASLLSVIKSQGGTPGVSPLSVVGSESVQASGDPTVNVPAGTPVGAGLIAITAANSVQASASITWNDPAGFTPVATLEPTGGSYPRVRVLEGERANGVDNYTFGASAGGKSGTIIALDGPIGAVTVATETTGSSTTPDPPSIAVPEGGVAIALVAVLIGAGGATMPGDYPEESDTTDLNRGGVVGTKAFASAGTADPGEITLGSSALWTATTIVIAPASA